MKKDELQAALNEATAENEKLKKRIEDLEKQFERKDNSGKNGNEKADEGKLSMLFEAIKRSCTDHCPYHKYERACKNCTINKIVTTAGYNLFETEGEIE